MDFIVSTAIVHNNFIMQKDLTLLLSEIAVSNKDKNIQEVVPISYTMEQQSWFYNVVQEWIT